MANIKSILRSIILRTEAREKAKHSREEYDALAIETNLSGTRRTENLRVLRAWMDTSQEDFAAAFGIGTQSHYSKVERGEIPLEDNEARRIECEFGLPTGWLDRELRATLFLSNQEWRLLKWLRQSIPDATPALTSLVRALIPTSSPRVGS